jgi:hypothetical protein
MLRADVLSTNLVPHQARVLFDVCYNDLYPVFLFGPQGLKEKAPTCNVLALAVFWWQFGSGRQPTTHLEELQRHNVEVKNVLEE